MVKQLKEDTLHPVWTFLQAADKSETLTAEWIGICCAAQFKKAHANNVSTDGTNVREKTLHIINCSGIDSSTISTGWINSFKRRHNTVNRNLAGESRKVDSESTDDWKNDWLLQEIKEYDLCDVCNNE
jgi:hypothetical protein